VLQGEGRFRGVLTAIGFNGFQWRICRIKMHSTRA